MLKKNKLFMLLLMVLIMGTLVACGSNTETGSASDEESGNKETIYLSYGAGTVGSAVNSVVLAHTKIFSDNVPNLQVSAQASGGGVDNLKFTEDNTFQISTAANISIYQAMNGVGDFESGALKNIRGLIPVYPSYVQIVVPSKSDIYTIEDMRGKKISVGNKGSGAEVICQSFFNGAGMSYEDFKPYYLAQQETMDGVKDGSLDVGFFATGVPASAVMELMTTSDVRLIEINTEEAAKITADYPFFSPGVIPAGTYKGQDKGIPTVQGFTDAYVHKDVPDDIVYAMVKALWEHKDQLGEIHASQKVLNPEMIETGLMPIVDLHPGAAK